jgi:hypothetical protein
MSSFFTPDFPTHHQGVHRLGSAVETLQQTGKQFHGARGLAAVLLAGLASALIVVADQIVSSWADGQLLVAWIALWALIFAAFALFSDVVRGWPAQFATAFETWKLESRRRAQDAQMWETASADPRLMAELRAAHLRAEQAAALTGEPAPQWPFGTPESVSSKYIA